MATLRLCAASCLCLVLLTLLGGCRSAPEATQVVFWTSEVEQDRMEVQQALARKFSETHPGVEVRVVPVDENVLPEKLASARAADRLPDVVELGLTQVVQYALEGLLDREAASEVVRELGEAGFYRGPLELCRAPAGSGYAAVPLDGWVQGIWYRKDWFEEKSLPPPDTWSRILEAARALHDPSVPRFGIVLGTHPQQLYTQQVFEHVALAAGARLLDDAGRFAAGPRLLQALRFYRELAAFAAPGHTYWREARQYYLTGRAAMIFYSPYIVDDIAGLVAEHQPAVPDLAARTGFVAAIQGPGGRPAAYGEVYALGVLTGARPEAKEWVAYVLGPVYPDWLSMAPGGKMPVRKDALARWRTQALFASYDPGLPDDLAAGFTRLARWGFGAPNGPRLIGDLYASKRVPEMVGRVLDNGEPPERALAWLREKVAQMAGRQAPER